MNDTFMKEKPVLPLLASMALPMVISMLVNSLYNIVDSFFVAKISEQAMAALLCGSITNIALDPVLIFGVGIFPKMGIAGAALATGIGQIVTLTVYLIVYFTRPLQIRLNKSYISANKKNRF